MALEVKITPIKLEIECYKDCCRICMCKETNMKSVFELTRIVEEIQFITGILIKPDAGLPTLVCENCLEKLSVACDFKNTCLQSDEMFQKMLTQKFSPHNIKEEVIDDDNNDGEQIEDNNDGHERVTKQDMDMDCGEKRTFDSEDELKTKRANRAKPARARPKRTSKISKSTDDTKTEKWVKNKLRELRCELCDLKFANKDLSLEHKRVVHGCVWICEICGKQFMHRASHYSHMRSHSPPQFKCAQCSYQTWHNADMKKHIRRHTGDKLFVCEYCTSSFYNTSNLYGHIRRNHGGVKSHFCPRCDQSFFTGDKLRRHLDSHDNIKRYECEVCHSQFTRRCHWKKHLHKQHSIVVPQIRPGRRKVNIVKGDDKVEPLSIVDTKKT